MTPILSYLLSDSETAALQTNMTNNKEVVTHVTEWTYTGTLTGTFQSVILELNGVITSYSIHYTKLYELASA